MFIIGLLQTAVAAVGVINKYSNIEELKRKEERERKEYWEKTPEQRHVADWEAVYKFLHK